MISRGLEIPASVPHLAMLGKPDTVFLPVVRTGYHTMERGGYKGTDSQIAELTTQSCVSQL